MMTTHYKKIELCYCSTTDTASSTTQTLINAGLAFARIISALLVTRTDGQIQERSRGYIESLHRCILSSDPTLSAHTTPCLFALRKEETDSFALIWIDEHSLDASTLTSVTPTTWTSLVWSISNSLVSFRLHLF